MSQTEQTFISRTTEHAELEDCVLGEFAAVLFILSFEHYIRQTFQKYFHEQDEKQNMPEQLSLSLRTVSFRVRT